MKFFCIADEDTVLGFQFAGVAGRAVTTNLEALTAIDEALVQPDCGIIIITQEIASNIREKIESIRFERNRPLIVEIPGPEGELPGRKTLRQFVQEAVGISVG